MKSDNKTDFQSDGVIPECRKIRKPLMEKKRRARINDSLETLKQILLDSKSNLKDNSCEKKSSRRTAKLEKADILEMTVLYIQNLRNKIKNKSDQPLSPNILTSVSVNYQNERPQEDMKRNVSIRPADSTCNSDNQTGLKLGITLVPTKLMNGDLAFIIPHHHVTPDGTVQKEDPVWRPW